jgi:RimJ/RimL family protein N-acetyltransferase
VLTIPTLTGDTVRLRPLVLGDADALAVAGSVERSTYELTPGPDSVEAAAAYVEAALAGLARGQRLPFAIEYHGKIVGSTSYIAPEVWTWPANSSHQQRDTPDVCEVGATWLSSTTQRTRCNTECKQLLLTHAFETWLVHRVAFRTDERNTRSRTAIERLGAKFEGVRRADLPGTDDTVRDSAYYSITSDEWPDTKAALTSRLDSAPN